MGVTAFSRKRSVGQCSQTRRKRSLQFERLEERVVLSALTGGKWVDITYHVDDSIGSEEPTVGLRREVAESSSGARIPKAAGRLDHRAGTCLSHADHDSVLIQARLTVTDLQGVPVDAIHVGDEFLLELTVQGLRDTGNDCSGTSIGVFAAYSRIFYDPHLVSTSGSTVEDVSFSSPYMNGRSAIFATPGLIDEFGAFASIQPTGGDELRLGVIRMRAHSVGNAMFNVDAADGLGHDFLIFGEDTPIPAEQIGFSGVYVHIEPSESGIVAASSLSRISDCAEVRKGDVSAAGTGAWPSALGLRADRSSNWLLHLLDKDRDQRFLFGVYEDRPVQGFRVSDPWTPLPTHDGEWHDRVYLSPDFLLSDPWTPLPVGDRTKVVPIHYLEHSIAAAYAEIVPVAAAGRGRTTPVDAASLSARPASDSRSLGESPCKPDVSQRDSSIEGVLLQPISSFGRLSFPASRSAQTIGFNERDCLNLKPATRVQHTSRSPPNKDLLMPPIRSRSPAGASEADSDISEAATLGWEAQAKIGRLWASQ